MNVEEGEVVLTTLPQADGQLKIRPGIALRIMPAFGDILICGISTQMHHQVVGFDEIVLTSDADFAASGLRLSSLIRLDFLTVQPLADIGGVIGAISVTRHERLLRQLSEYLIADLGS